RIEQEVLGAGRIRDHTLQRRLVLLEELLDRQDELLADLLILIVGEDGHGAQEADGPPGHRQRGPHDLRLIFLGHEAAPGLHEPPVMNVLGAAEGLARTRAELPFEEIGEGLLDDVAGLGEVTLANATDLNLRRAAVRFTATMIWLASLVKPPKPSGPRYVIVLPMAWKIGSTVSNTALSPPAMMESAPSMAPFSPPDTGASNILTPLASSVLPIFWLTIGEIVDISTKSSPGRAPSTTPFFPSATTSTSGELGSIVM